MGDWSRGFQHGETRLASGRASRFVALNFGNKVVAGTQTSARQRQHGRPSRLPFNVLQLEARSLSRPPTKPTIFTTWWVELLVIIRDEYELIAFPYSCVSRLVVICTAKSSGVSGSRARVAGKSAMGAKRRAQC